MFIVRLRPALLKAMRHGRRYEVCAKTRRPNLATLLRFLSHQVFLFPAWCSPIRSKVLIGKSIRQNIFAGYLILLLAKYWQRLTPYSNLLKKP
jgi:hypothetical protein